MNPRWLAAVFSLGLVAGLVVWFVWDWNEILAELSLPWIFPGALALTAIVLLILTILSFTGWIWPPAPPSVQLPNPSASEAYAKWAAECEATSARATAIALFIGVIGGAVAWGSLKASLLSYEAIPEQVRGEGSVLICRNDLKRSTAQIRIRTIGSGRARITDLGVFVQIKDERETELFSHPISPVLEIAGDDSKSLPGIENFNRVLGPKLDGMAKEKRTQPEQIELIRLEPRYTDMLRKSRTPEDKRYKVNIFVRTC